MGIRWWTFHVCDWAVVKQSSAGVVDVGVGDVGGMGLGEN